MEAGVPSGDDGHRPDVSGAARLGLMRAALAVLGLGLGFWGGGWGLPNQGVIDRIMPPGADNPDFHKALSESWGEMHRGLGSNLVLNPEAYAGFKGVIVTEPGWRSPPRALWNSYRSFHLRSAHDDEQTFFILLSRMRPRQLEFRHHMFTYGAAHIYSLGAWLAAGAALQVVTLKTSVLPYLEQPARMAGLYWWCRVLSVLAYAGSALMLLRIGRRHLALGAAGFCAGAAFLLSPGAVIQAHVLKQHTFWTFWVLLTLDQSLALLDRARVRDWCLAGATAGLAVGCFAHAWPAGLILAAAAVLRGRRSGRWTPELQGLGWAVLAAAAVFIGTNPYWILDWPEAHAELTLQRRFLHRDPLAPLLFFWHPVRRSVTTPVLALMAAGVLGALIRGRNELKLRLVSLTFLFGVAATAGYHVVLPTRSVRYFLGWLAVGLLLAAWAAWSLARGAKALRPAVIAGGLLILANLGVEGLTTAYNFHRDAGESSTRLRAGRWIEEHVPPGESIGQTILPAPSTSPYFRFDRYRMVFIEPALFKDLAPEKLPKYFVVCLPDYDSRHELEPNLSRYESVARIDRERLVPWVGVDPTATTANPAFEVYRLR